MDPWLPQNPKVTCCPNCRSVKRYFEVVRQFNVEADPRYQPANGQTFCNVFATDVAQAMGRTLPHWWLANEESANKLADWLDNQGKNYGWQEVTDAGDCSADHTINGMVATGVLCIAIWKNPSGGPGHVAVILPIDTGGLWIAQAGAHNFVGRPLAEGFGDKKPRFYTCP